MNPFNLFNIRQEEYQLVVVLQDDHACWFRWRGQELAGTWSEPLSSDSLKRRTRCPWIPGEEGGTACRVRLVLDTKFDEVDRVRVDGLSRGWINAVQRRKMAHRLQADYPLASIHQLPGYASPDVLSIVHHIIPPEWEEWLRQLQSQEICITHAVTSLELLCECERDWSVIMDSQASNVEQIDGPVLIDLPVGSERRHLLVDHGVPLFMRLVKIQGEAIKSEEYPALQETLQHVREQITRDALTPPVLCLVPLWPELAQRLQTASMLAALCIGSSVSLQPMPGADRHAASISEPGDQKSDVSGLRPLYGRVLSSVGQLLHRKNENQRWCLTDEQRFSSDFLQSSITTNRLHLRIRQLQKATLICAWMAAASVVIASTHGINSARAKASLSNEKQQLRGRIDHLAESVSALSDEPGLVVRSAARIDAHESVKPIEALGVMAIIAGVIDEFPAIILDSLSWSVMADNQPVELVLGSISQVIPRERLWDADSTVARLQVNLSGTVMDQQALGLREQQEVLQSFVNQLQALPEVVEVNVLEAPVNAARSSDRMMHEGSGYHLSLQLGVF